ncbi:MAG: hypothetical protein ACYDHM_10975 [Acidiferrobacterales bacterium]
MAMRSERMNRSREIPDIEAPVRMVGIQDAAAVLSLVETFCPASRIRIKPDLAWKKSCKE